MPEQDFSPAVPHLRSELLDHPSIRHGFFGRQGGVSQGVYAGLNTGLGSGDNPDHVASNRQLVVMATLGSLIGGNTEKHLITLAQIHSKTVVVIDDRTDAASWPQSFTADRMQGDALVTQLPNVILGVMSADCLPLLLHAPDIQAVAAIHAGWRGTLQGIVPATLKQLQQLGADLGQLRVAAGPHLRAASFEVGADLRDAFLAEDAGDAAAFSPSPTQSDKWQFDLSAVVSRQLAASGVSHIDWGAAPDTYSDPQRWFSFRRTTHRGEQDYGRQIAVISLVG
jgi:YfiH family protein